MPIVLARIDDRFIHGQVSVGWGRRLRPDHIVLCNQEIAADPWQCRVYGSSVTPPVRVSIRDCCGAAALLDEGAEAAGLVDAGAGERERVILLVGSPADMLALLRRGLRVREVNVGGMHHARGKREMLEFVYVDRGDLNAFRQLLDAGVRLFAQQVPGSRRHEIDAADLDAMEKEF